MNLEDLFTTCGFLLYGWLFALMIMQGLNSGFQPGVLAGGLAAGYLLRMAYGKAGE